MRWSICKVPASNYKAFMDQTRAVGNTTGRISICPVDSTDKKPIMRIEVFAPPPCSQCGSSYQSFAGRNNAKPS